MNPCSSPFSSWTDLPACGGWGWSPSGGHRSILAKELGLESALRRPLGFVGQGIRKEGIAGLKGPCVFVGSLLGSWLRAALQTHGPGHPHPLCGVALNTALGDAAFPAQPQGASLAEHTGGRSAGSSEHTPLKVKDHALE